MKERFYNAFISKALFIYSNVIGRYLSLYVTCVYVYMCICVYVYM